MVFLPHLDIDFNQLPFPCIPAYVKSQTLIGDGKHSEGVKIVEIVHGNIPVKNGVVHLISKPLMIVDGTVDQFLKVT